MLNYVKITDILGVSRGDGVQGARAPARVTQQYSRLG